MARKWGKSIEHSHNDGDNRVWSRVRNERRGVKRSRGMGKPDSSGTANIYHHHPYFRPRLTLALCHIAHFQYLHRPRRHLANKFIKIVVVFAGASNYIFCFAAEPVACISVPCALCAFVNCVKGSFQFMLDMVMDVLRHITIERAWFVCLRRIICPFFYRTLLYAKRQFTHTIHKDMHAIFGPSLVHKSNGWIPVKWMRIERRGSSVYSLMPIRSNEQDNDGEFIHFVILKMAFIRFTQFIVAISFHLQMSNMKLSTYNIE